jgi:hypothetical protein
MPTKVSMVDYERWVMVADKKKIQTYEIHYLWWVQWSLSKNQHLPKFKKSQCSPNNKIIEKVKKLRRKHSISYLSAHHLKKNWRLCSRNVSHGFGRPRKP